MNGPLSPDRTPVIVGVGNTEQGELPGLSADLISVQAIENALADAGLDKSDVNGLVTCKPLGTEEEPTKGSLSFWASTLTLARLFTMGQPTFRRTLPPWQYRQGWPTR